MPKKSKDSLFKSFGYAFEGLHVLFRDERNFRIHTFFALVIPVFGLLLGISLIEHAIILTHIVLVLTLEAINTIVEYILDIKYNEYNQRVKVLKDVAASIVLIPAISSVIVGLMIFLPKILDIVKGWF
jgi:diacylglycerol kinase